MSGFKKAERKNALLRMAVFGPSGAGKTFTSLRVMRGLVGDGKIALIDTEHGSASLYADRFDFDVLELTESASIDEMIGAMKAAVDGGYKALVIDSLSHCWQELLDEVNKLAKAKYGGNTWSAWSDGTPKQKKLVKALLRFPGHIIATMRSKTEWVQEKNDKGKSVPVRVGMAPEQGKGIEYEFTILLELSVDHLGTVIKDRTGHLQDKILEKPGEEMGKWIGDWLSGTVKTKGASDGAGS